MRFADRTGKILRPSRADVIARSEVCFRDSLFGSTFGLFHAAIDLRFGYILHRYVVASVDDDLKRAVEKALNPKREHEARNAARLLTRTALDGSVLVWRSGSFVLSDVALIEALAYAKSNPDVRVEFSTDYRANVVRRVQRLFEW